MAVFKIFLNRQHFKALAFLLLIVLSSNVTAQLQGPVVQCINCEQYPLRTEPYNGVWYNPQQSGTGYSIEVQKGTVFGIYYGYDADGKPLWLTFVAELVPSDEPGIMWTLDADLTKMQNGNCTNCDYQAPEVADFQSTIHIDFRQINYASINVNGGAEQNIIPFNYRFDSNADFPELSDYKLPDLKGVWAFTFRTNWEVLLPITGYGNQWAFNSISLSISSKSPAIDLDNDGNQEIWYYADLYIQGTPEILPYGAIKCEEQKLNGVKIGPTCVYINPQALSTADFGELGLFHFSLGGLGPKRIFGQTIDGHTFEAIKIDSTDYQSK